jgi:hypothetical protein
MDPARRIRHPAPTTRGLKRSVIPFDRDLGAGGALPSGISRRIWGACGVAWAQCPDSAPMRHSNDKRVYCSSGLDRKRVSCSTFTQHTTALTRQAAPPTRPTSSCQVQ